MKVIKNFIKEEDGISTVEVVVIIAILVGVALIFKDKVGAFVSDTLDKVFDKQDQIIN